VHIIEIVLQVESALKALRRVLLEAAPDEMGDSSRNGRIHLVHQRRCVAKNRREHRDAALARKWPRSRRQFVEDDAEGEDVGTVIDWLPLRLLRPGERGIAGSALSHRHPPASRGLHLRNDSENHTFGRPFHSATVRHLEGRLFREWRDQL